MLKRWLYRYTSWLFCASIFVGCQVLPKNNNTPTYVVPFEYLNNFIIIKAHVNEVVPMNLIFDTGAQFTVLLDPLLTQLAGVQLEKRFPLIGSDRSKILQAYRTNLVELSIGNIPTIKRKIMYLSGVDFDLSSYTGKEIHGILGADILLNTLFRINHKTQEIEFYRHKGFTAPKGYETLSLFSDASRPELLVHLDNQKNDSLSTRMLMDTGASITMILLENEERNITIPKNVLPAKIADGLGGQVEGFMARSHGIRFGKHYFEGFLFHYQSREKHIESSDSLLSSRDGILGNKIMDNFDIFFDMAFKYIHVHPYKNKFKINQRENTTGIFLVMGGPDFQEPIIEQVLPKSPAAKAGIEAGWKIRAVNGWPISMLTVERIFNVMESKPGKMLKLTLEKDGIRKKFKFTTAKLL